MAIYIVRHGDTDMNDKATMRGWSDVSLNDKGRKQAQSAADSLKNKGVTKIVTSDLPRAQETADIIGKATGAEVHQDPGLRSWNTGFLTGRPVSEVMPVLETFIKKPKVQIPYGESFEQFKSRWLGSFDDHEATHEGNVAMVTSRSNILTLRDDLQGKNHSTMHEDWPPPGVAVSLEELKNQKPKAGGEEGQ